MKFGIFDHIDRSDAPIPQLYEERMQLAEKLDEAGFYAIHIAEHHMTKLGMAPSPNVYLAALAQCTKKIRIGSIVHLLPLYEPIRLLEELGMVDNLSNGRLDIGLGRGISPYEGGYFGVTPQESRTRFVEMVDLIIAGMQSERFTWKGDHYTLNDVPMEIPMVQKPHPPLWVGAHHTSTLDFAARYGCNVVIGGPNAAVKRAAEYYPGAWEKFADSPNRKNSPVADPLVGGWRFPFIADTEKEAEAIAKPAFEMHMEHLASLWKAWGGLPGIYVDSWEKAKASQVYIAGTADQIRQRLADDIGETGVNYMIFSMCWGSMTHEQSVHSLELFTQEVMPHFVD